MILYLVKSALCLALMLAVYFLFLEKEKMHRFNRFYLLFSIVFSCLVPLNKLTVYLPQTPVLHNYPIQNINLYHFSTPVKTVQPDHDLLLPILLTIYGLVALVFLFRFIKNIYLILLKISKNEIIVLEDAKVVLLQQEIISHTFLNYIFISAGQYHKQALEKEVFTHELTHVRQKHSLDILFIELLQVFLWFNPILILYKKAIRLNHEFLADEAVIATYHDVKHYQHLLINNISLNSGINLTSNFNYHITRKRLIVMAKAGNNKNIFFKKIAVASVVASAVYLFSTRVEARDNSYFKQPALGYIKENLNKKIALINVKNNPNVVKSKTDTIIKKESEEKKYSSIISGSDGLGPNPLVLIDNIEYPSKILYEIGRACIKGSSTMPPINAIKQFGPKAKDGCVQITTKNGLITYLTSVEKENMIKESSVSLSQFYTRLQLTEEDGSLYDKIIMHVSPTGSVSTTLSHNGRAGFFIDKKFYDEDGIKKVSPAVIASLSGAYGVRGANSGVKEEQGYERIFDFTTKQGVADTLNQHR